jgi:hypothetical protein
MQRDCVAFAPLIQEGAIMYRAGIAQGLLLSALACLLTTDAAAQPTCTTTLVAGNYFSQTWDLAGSPYCVTGDILVGDLIVDPGVEVFIDGPYQIDVFAVIVAVGTAQLPILFSAKLPGDPDNQRWRGFKFTDAPAGSLFTHVTIEYSNEAAISLSGSPAPPLDHCLIQNNTNSERGGGISGQIVSSDLSITDSIIQNNLAGEGGAFGSGGAIYVANLNGSLFITRSEISNNESGDVGSPHALGGAIQVTEISGDLDISDSVFDSNHGDGTGGALSVLRFSGVGTISSSLFLNNVARSAGAARIYMSGSGELTVSDSVFANNTAATDGESAWAGALLLNGTTTVENSYLGGNKAEATCQTSCSATAYGGAILSSGSLTIRDTLVSGNSLRLAGLASGDTLGGGIYITGSAVSLEMENVLVTCNSSSGGTSAAGSGLWLGVDAVVKNVTVARNQPAEGIEVAASTLDMRSSIVFENGSTTGIALSGAGPVANIGYSDVQTPGPDPMPGTGNIRTAPGFQGDACNKTDFVTFSISPSVDGGDPSLSEDDACLPPGQGTMLNDMGAFGGPGNCTPLPEPGRVGQFAAAMFTLLMLSRHRARAS